jgi:hypothetical protein
VISQSNLILPELGMPTFPEVYAGAASPAAAERGGGYDEHRPKTPPPDLPSLLLDSRIVYLGMPVRTSLVPRCKADGCSLGVVLGSTATRAGPGQSPIHDEFRSRGGD